MKPCVRVTIDYLIVLISMVNYQGDLMIDEEFLISNWEQIHG